MKYHLTPKSANAKAGPIPVSTSSAETCPKSCGQYSACYAKSGPLALHWKQVTLGARGMELPEFLNAIANLPSGQVWRHNQAGDLPGVDETIDAEALSALVAANKGKRGFTYTHKHSLANLNSIREANAGGFTINLSADTVEQADALKSAAAGPVVVVLPEQVKANFITPAGNRVVICPATTRENVSCATCKLCAIPDRAVVIGFPAHGTSKTKVAVDPFFILK